MEKQNEKTTNRKRFQKEKKRITFFRKYNIKWVLIITLWTFLLAISVSMVSESIMRNFDIIAAFIVLIIIIYLGVIFDIIGIAVAAADEKPFHAMAANRIPEGKYAAKMVRNAGPVSNFCNDVVGDIAGIISGAASTIIVIKVVKLYGLIDGGFISVIMTGFVASLTVGGKALGKEIAIKKARHIVFYTAKIFMFLHQKLGITLLPDLKKRKER